jgi:tetratricopeptide (TPR) repeat protein
MKASLRGVWLVLALLTSTTLVAQKKKRDGAERGTERPNSGQVAEAERTFTDGMKYFLMEDYGKAVPLLEQALQLNPENAGIQFALATVLTKAGQADRAVPFAEKAFLLDAENKYHLVLLAELYQKKHNYAEAAKLYQILQQRYPDNAEYGIELASIFVLQDKHDDALKAYDRLEKSLGVTEEITRQKQMILLKQNKFNEAIKESEKLIATDPGEVEYMVDLAEMLLNHDRNDQAIPWLERILKIRPDNAQAHIMLADLYRKRGDLEKTNQELEKAFADPNLDGQTKARVLTSYLAMLPEEARKAQALKFAQSLVQTDPNQPQAHVIQADLLMQKGDKAGARDAYLRAARLDGSLNEVWDRVIRLDGDLNQIDSVVKHSEEAIELFPNQAEFWYANGSALLMQRQYKPAVDALEEARRLATRPELQSFIHAQLGDAYNGVAQHEKSDQAYEEALKRDPANEHVLNNYSYFLSLRKAKLDRAQELSAKLLALQPDNGTYLDTHAWVLYTKGQYGAARNFLEKALKSKQVSGTVVEHYGDVLFQLGEKDKALEQWRRAKTMGQTSGVLDRKIATGSLQ